MFLISIFMDFQIMASTTKNANSSTKTVLEFKKNSTEYAVNFPLEKPKPKS